MTSSNFVEIKEAAPRFPIWGLCTLSFEQWIDGRVIVPCGFPKARQIQQILAIDKTERGLSLHNHIIYVPCGFLRNGTLNRSRERT